MSESLGRSLHASSVQPDAEAGPLLRLGYEGMRAREKSIAPIDRRRLAEAVDRLIELYTATNKPDEAERWRAERARSVDDPGSKPIEEKWRTPTRHRTRQSGPLVVLRSSRH